MITTESDVTRVMNTAVSYLEDTGLPVTPHNHYAMCNAWYESLEGSRHPVALQTRSALLIALMRLNATLTLIETNSF